MNFNSEKIGYKNSSAHELLPKKYATFSTIHDQKWRQPIKMLDVIFGQKRKNVAYFFGKSSCALEFL